MMRYYFFPHHIPSLFSAPAATLVAAVEAAGRPRVTARRALVTAAAGVDRVTPATEDTNINSDTCLHALDEAISVLDRIGFHRTCRFYDID